MWWSFFVPMHFFSVTSFHTIIMFLHFILYFKQIVKNWQIIFNNFQSISTWIKRYIDRRDSIDTLQLLLPFSNSSPVNTGGELTLRLPQFGVKCIWWWVEEKLNKSYFFAHTTYTQQNIPLFEYLCITNDWEQNDCD